jgi:hypothetical protein
VKPSKSDAVATANAQINKSRIWRDLAKGKVNNDPNNFAVILNAVAQIILLPHLFCRSFNILA